MDIIPDFLRSQIESHLDAALLWFSNHIYEHLAPKFADHPLLRLDELLDLDAMVAACDDYHKNNGNGHPVDHPVDRLFRAILVRYFYDKSLRDTTAMIRENIPVKYFVGYPIGSRGMSYSTLHRFEAYLMITHPRLFFDEVLGQIAAAFPEQKLHPQLGDTFAVLANAQRETLIGRLRHGAACLLLALHGERPAAFHQVAAQVELATLVGEAKERREFFLSKKERAARLTATVTEVDRLLAALPAVSPRRKDVGRYRDLLREILEKEVAIERDEEEAITAVRKLEEKERGSYRPTSATDPDATIRNHGKDKQDNGYNVSLAATTDFIWAIEAATGSQPDAMGIVPLLETQAEHHDHRPPKLIYDRAAGDGQTIAAMHEASQGKTQLVTDPVQRGKEKENPRFGPLDCTLSEVVDEESGEILPALTCPGGETTTTRYRSGSGEGWTYRIPSTACAVCPLQEQCLKTAQPPQRHRQWFISDYRAPLLAALAYRETDDFKADMKLRPQVERVIAGLVLHNGARRARFRGLEKVDFQMKMCATAYNLKRWLALVDPKRRRPKPRGTAAGTVLRLAGEK